MKYEVRRNDDDSTSHIIDGVLYVEGEFVYIRKGNFEICFAGSLKNVTITPFLDVLSNEAKEQLTKE